MKGAIEFVENVLGLDEVNEINKIQDRQIKQLQELIAQQALQLKQLKEEQEDIYARKEKKEFESKQASPEQMQQKLADLVELYHEYEEKDQEYEKQKVYQSLFNHILLTQPKADADEGELSAGEAAKELVDIMLFGDDEQDKDRDLKLLVSELIRYKKDNNRDDFDLTLQAILSSYSDNNSDNASLVTTIQEVSATSFDDWLETGN